MDRDLGTMLKEIARMNADDECRVSIRRNRLQALHESRRLRAPTRITFWRIADRAKVAA